MNGQIDGVGLGRDAFELLNKGVQEGKIISFVVSTEYTDAYKDELAILHGGRRADGTSGMLGSPVQLSTQCVMLINTIVQNAGRGGAALGGGILQAIAHMLSKLPGVSATIISSHS